MHNWKFQTSSPGLLTRARNAHGAHKSVGGPIPEVSFVPTGGVTPALAKDYLALDNVFAVGGSWLSPEKLLRDGNFEAISERARDAIALA